MMNKKKVIAVFLCLVFFLAGSLVMAQQEIINEDINKSVGDLEIYREITVNGDVNLSIGSVSIWGAVNGDVSADMGEVAVSGEVTGDVSADMGKVIIDGNVIGNVSADMGEVIINGNVTGNVKSSLGKIRIAGNVTGDVTSELGEVLITGLVGGNVRSEGKKIIVQGIVDGDIYLTLGTVELGPGAIVGGNIYVDEGRVFQDEGAQYGDIEIRKELTADEIDGFFVFPGGISFRGIDNFGDFFRDRHSWRKLDIFGFRPGEFPGKFRFGIGSFPGDYKQRAVTLIILFVLSILVYTLFPKHVERVMVNVEKNPGKAVIWGVIAALLAVPVMILLAITIVGIPLIVVEILIFAAAWILGYAGITFLIGGRILETAKSGTDNAILKILIGVLLLGMVSFIPIGGAIITVAVFVMSVGASLISQFGSAAGGIGKN